MPSTAGKIIGNCPDCHSTYEEGNGAMLCRNCGKIESFRMIAYRIYMGVDTSLYNGSASKPAENETEV